MIETKRLSFRPWREADAEELFRLASDPDVGPRAGWPPHKSVEESLEIINTVFNSDHVWAFNSKGFLTLWADHFVDNPLWFGFSYNFNSFKQKAVQKTESDRSLIRLGL